MKKIVLLLLLGAVAPRAEELRFSVGLGAGLEAGNGLRLGIARGKNMAEAGIGLLYHAQDAELQYSTGLRYLRTLYSGRINKTYAWAGAGITGYSRSGDSARTGDSGYLASAGAGLGISLHFGLPFHLNFDSGWHILHDSERSQYGPQSGPTLNGALVYEW